LVKPSGPGDLLFSIPFKETKISSIVTGLSQTSFYLILSKLICNRMSVFTNNIIGIDQTCALKGRSILPYLSKKLKFHPL
jgi:hypothetical protein